MWIFIIAIVLLFPSNALSIGCGGLLVKVPYAKVIVDGVNKEWDAYVHPIEGSWLVIPPGKDAYAMDKSKKHSIVIKKSDLLSTRWNYVVDGPENIPFLVQKNRPEFERYYAKTLLDDGRLIEVYIKR